MPLKEKLSEDFKRALKEKDENKLSVLKMVRAAISNKEIETGKKEEGLSDEEIQNTLRSEAKKRNDSIDAYAKGGRQDMAEKEKSELTIIQSYLPPELSDEEIEKTVKAAISKTNATSQNDFNRVIREAMAELKGKASGERVSKKIKELLAA